MQMNQPTLRVQGHGQVATNPDIVVLHIELSFEGRDYGKTVTGLNARLDALRGSVTHAGEDSKELKTVSFGIDVAKDYVDGRYVFRGFKGGHSLELRMPFDQARLARVFSSITESKAEPELSIQFTVSDPEAIRRGVLANAVANARQRAEIIATAAGQQLGRIIAIDYGYAEVRVSSECYDVDAVVLSEAAPELAPADIESADTIRVTWEIGGNPGTR